jgi:hypothetical protein
MLKTNKQIKSYNVSTLLSAGKKMVLDISSQDIWQGQIELFLGEGFC